MSRYFVVRIVLVGFAASFVLPLQAAGLDDKVAQRACDRAYKLHGTNIATLKRISDRVKARFGFPCISEVLAEAGIMYRFKKIAGADGFQFLITSNTDGREWSNRDFPAVPQIMSFIGDPQRYGDFLLFLATKEDQSKSLIIIDLRMMKGREIQNVISPLQFLEDGKFITYTVLDQGKPVIIKQRLIQLMRK